jgi:hypothetical protein
MNRLTLTDVQSGKIAPYPIVQVKTQTEVEQL